MSAVHVPTVPAVGSTLAMKTVLVPPGPSVESFWPPMTYTKRAVVATREFVGSASAMAWCARVSGSELADMVVQLMFVVLPTVPSGFKLIE